MKVTFPHIGTGYIGIKALLEALGLEVVVPPKSSKRTLSLGVKYAPEFACLPFKINLGNFIEAIEAGADVIVMGGGIGPCRFGYYAEVQREILRDLGYSFEMVVLEPPQGKVGHLIDRVKQLVGPVTARQIIDAARIAWVKVAAADALEKEAQRVRAFEVRRGDADRVLEKAFSAIDAADSVRAVKLAREEWLQRLDEVEQDPSLIPLRIGIVGEVYVVLDPFSNLFTEKHLGELGVWVDRKIWAGEWVKENIFLDIFRIGGRSHAKELAQPYLCHFVGGHGVDTVGNAVEYARRGFDGVIQIAPFTCMPEIVAQSVLPSVSRDLGIPSITLVFDEHTGEAGMRTRLEAFCDLLEMRRRKAQESCGVAARP